MKISILTPSYNSGKYIERAILSVVNQQYSNFEHIVMDGGSNDNTVDILSKYPHVIWKSEPDSGQSDAMNKAFALSSGDLIAYLNADDAFESGAFAAIAKTFQQYPQVDMVVGDIRIVLPDYTIERSPSEKYLDVVQYWLDLFPANPVSYFYRSHLQESIGKFPVHEHYTMDIWFLLKAYQKFKIKKINSLLGTFYFDGNNKTAVADNRKNQHEVVKKHLNKDNPLLIPLFYFLYFRHYQGLNPKRIIKALLRKIAL